MPGGNSAEYHNSQQYNNAPHSSNATQYSTRVAAQYGNPQLYTNVPQQYPQAHYPNARPPDNSHQYYSTQPQPTQMMQITPGGNRNALNKPLDSKGDRSWSFGLCDFFNDCGTCVLACIFPCGVYAQNKSRLEHLEKKGVPHPHGGDMCNMDCCCHCCLNSWSLLGIPACGWILQMNTRSSIRTRYHIGGGGCGDCCSAFWCTPCELTQGSQELELEENSFGRN